MALNAGKRPELIQGSKPSFSSRLGGSAMASWQRALLSHLREDRMLHKTSKLLGFHLVARDGEIGHG